MGNPVVLIHGYSGKGESFKRWSEVLEQAGHDVTTIHTCNYRTLTNEVTIKDIAEGFDRALRIEAGFDGDTEFDAIVHSTGMLVIRAWLAAYAKRRSRLKHLIGLAPATFGSPLAHKGRSWLGSIFKGEKEFGPDFLEAGDLVLDGLELGSRFTWGLAHDDMVGGNDFYGRSAETPYVFVFCGTSGYEGLRRLVNEPGTDGTVRLAGCALNSRKITMDLTVEAGERGSRTELGSWSSLDVPLIPIPDLNHGTILSEPSALLADLVISALNVDSAGTFDQWLDNAGKTTEETKQKTEKWQQFVVRVVDERNDPVTDYYVEVFTDDGESVKQFNLDTHTYTGDNSLRCFHVNLDEIRAGDLKSLKVRLIASSGSELIGYYGYGSERIDPETQTRVPEGKWDAVVDMSELLKDPENKINFFFPFTTTLIEIKINREPMPPFGKNKLFEFMSVTKS
jgi:pimeloyl-ACP methyl ester carboxylesterase